MKSFGLVSLAMFVSTLVSTLAFGEANTVNGGGFWTDDQGRQVPYEASITYEKSASEVRITSNGTWIDPDTGKSRSGGETIVKKLKADGAYDIYLATLTGDQETLALAGAGSCKVIEKDGNKAWFCREQYKNDMGMHVDIESLYCQKKNILSRQGTMRIGHTTHRFFEVLN